MPIQYGRAFPLSLAGKDVSRLLSAQDFLRPAVSAALKDSYTRVLEHLRTGRLSAGDLQQIQKALTFLTPTCRMSREAQRDLMGVNLKTTALLRSCH